ncbi:MAG: hypothetical protein CMG97_13550 [Marinovum sp.]|nr:hypothetical protein [Marinovum sp.]
MFSNYNANREKTTCLEKILLSTELYTNQYKLSTFLIKFHFQNSQIQDYSIVYLEKFITNSRDMIRIGQW